MINVLFFASLREQLNCEKLSLTEDLKTVAEVKEKLIALHPDWQVHFNNSALLNAVNQEMASDSTKVSDGDDVAFFPPVTGG